MRPASTAWSFVAFTVNRVSSFTVNGGRRCAARRPLVGCAPLFQYFPQLVRLGVVRKQAHPRHRSARPSSGGMIPGQDDSPPRVAARCSRRNI